MNDLLKKRVDATKRTLGKSGEDIIGGVFNYISRINSKEEVKILDIGCGAGDLLRLFRERYPNARLHGMDLGEYGGYDGLNINFSSCDCNDDYSQEMDKFDFVIASEVIEHVENPWHFVRQFANLLEKGGYGVITTPNIEALTSIVSFIVRGYHSAFSPRNFPEHKTALSVYEMKNIISESDKLELIEVCYINRGRIPGTPFKWQSFLPFLRGKRFMDNYMVVVRSIC